MAFKTWQVVKIRYCDNAGKEVALEAEAIYPADFIPDTAPRIQGHRCSNAVHCAMYKKTGCMWSGANPNFDPFAEKDAD